MISILLSFSRRVAGGVLRRKKSSTRVALRAHIGRLRSVSFVRDNDHIAKPRYTYKTAISWENPRENQYIKNDRKK
jgi:hypothetical protein